MFENENQYYNRICLKKTKSKLLQENKNIKAPPTVKGHRCQTEKQSSFFTVHEDWTVITKRTFRMVSENDPKRSAPMTKYLALSSICAARQHRTRSYLRGSHPQVSLSKKY